MNETTEDQKTGSQFMRELTRALFDLDNPKPKKGEATEGSQASKFKGLSEEEKTAYKTKARALERVLKQNGLVLVKK